MSEKSELIERIDVMLSMVQRRYFLDSIYYRANWKQLVDRERQHAREKYSREHDREHGVQHLLDWAEKYARPFAPQHDLVKAAGLLESAKELVASDD